MKKNINFDNKNKRVFVTADVNIKEDMVEMYFGNTPSNICDIVVCLEGVTWYGESNLLCLPKKDVIFIGDATRDEGIDIQ